ncbi:MAG TPA: MDR family oxidoreductase [Acidimicrobiales bacterium]|nr:MDR family oxidoreductase [Acidimicrobiales bacterium]
MTIFPAIVATGDGPATLVEQTDADLPAGDVTVAVRWSSLNYKDGLAVSGRAKIARSFPMTCGIDLAGTVVASEAPEWAVGDEVVLTGWGLSETHPGGYSGRQNVRSPWLVRRPESMTLAQTMAVGTAGLTAALCVDALESHGLSPDDGGEVLVTGAAGGVGSVAVALLAAAGYRVAASTGRPELADHLRAMGATTIVSRAELAEAGRPLAKERWAAAIDTVGSQTLATVLSQTRYRGAVAACGLAGGNDLPTTVLPFILRNVALLGVDSVQCPADVRARAWQRLAQQLPLDKLDAMTTTEPLERVPALAEQIVAGQIRGRVVIDVAGQGG